MIAWMHADAVGRLLWPKARTASIRCCGRDVGVLVVARMTERRMEAVRRLDDKLALIIEALSLKLPRSNLR